MRVLAPVVCAILTFVVGGCECNTPRTGACRVDADCDDDGRFCTGSPTCELGVGGGLCRSGRGPCRIDEVCDEAGDRCVDCDARPDDPICDTVVPDAGPQCDAVALGEPCIGAGTCAWGECQLEQASASIPTSSPAGGAGRPAALRLLPGGYCAESCNPNARNDTCGPCAACVGEGLLGAVRLRVDALGGVAGVCRETCSPSSVDTGCEREGYACDLETRTCLEACVDDAQCQLDLRDLDGDGQRELVDRGRDFPAYCDAVTGRCRVRGRPGARVGDPCRDDDACMDDGVCLFNDGGATGLCALPGCRGGSVTCPADTICDVRNVEGGDVSACLPRCTVGLEEGTPDRLGRGAGHPRCGAGRSCVWSGGAERPDAGSCVPGEYNDVATSNVGEACVDAAQCWSPFGYAACAFTEPLYAADVGMCTVRHCSTFLDASGDEVQGLWARVALESPICDPSRGEECVSMPSGSTRTYCLERCDEPSTCVDGYACRELFSGRRYCWPNCRDDGDCGSDRCLDAAGEACGTTRGPCHCRR